MARSDLYRALLESPAFRVRDLPKELRARPYLTQELAQLESRGRLRRIRRGVYVVVPPAEVGTSSFTPDPFIVASVLTRPYAVSFHSALALRGLAESFFHRVYVQSPKRFNRFSSDGIEYVWVSAKSLFGVETHYRATLPVQVTDTERTLLDCLRFPKYAGGLDELFRSLEGIEKYDLLSVVLERSAEKAAPPDRRKLRAEFEDDRASMDALEDAGLLRTERDKLHLTVLGLSFCPHPRAEREMANVRKLFDYLRSRYKADPEAQDPVSTVARALDLQVGDIQRAAMTLSHPKFATRMIMEPGTMAYPLKIGAGESILDYRTLEQFLVRELSRFSPPKTLSLKKKGLASIRFDRLLLHLKAFKDASLYAKTGFTLSVFARQWSPPPDLMRELSRKVTPKRYYFPPDLKKGAGKFIGEWNLIVPSHLYTRYLMAKAAPEGEARAALH